MKHTTILSLLCIGSLASAVHAEQDVVELGQLLKHAKKEERREAAYQLHQLGADAALVTRQLATALDDEDDQVWFQATMALAKIGPKAAPAIPKLIEQMGGGNAHYAEQRSRRSAYALSEVGPVALPALLSALEDENQHRRWGALHALGLINKPDPETVDATLALLADEDAIVRAEAVETCIIFGEPIITPTTTFLIHDNEAVRLGAATILRRLSHLETTLAQRDLVRTALLKETDSKARAAFLRSAAAMGVDAEFLSPWIIAALLGSEEEVEAAFQIVLDEVTVQRETLPTLTALLSAQDSEHRQRSAMLLGRIGEKASPAAHALVARLHDGGLSPTEESALLNALILIGPSVLPHILAEVQSTSPEAMVESHWAIRALQGLTPITLPEMEAALPTASPTVACALLHALPRYTQRNRPVETHVRQWLTSPNASLRASAVTMLTKLPVPEKVWITATHNALKDPSATVRLTAIDTIDLTPLSSEQRLEALVSALSDEEPEVRSRSVEALGELGSSAAGAVPILLASVEGPSPTSHYRAGVIETFGRIGTGAAAAVPYLRSMLHDAIDESTQVLTLGAIASIGAAATEAMPEILQLCQSPRAELRRSGFHAFANVEQDAKAKLPIFVRALDDPDAATRQAVIGALGALREDAAPAAARLVDLLESEEDRKVALEALTVIRPEDLELCLRLLKSPNAGGRLLACDRLGRMKNPAALPALREALQDAEGYVRRRAREAISRIEKG